MYIVQLGKNIAFHYELILFKTLCIKIKIIINALFLIIALSLLIIHYCVLHGIYARYVLVEFVSLQTIFLNLQVN
jgi:hypothetical protein